MATILFDKHGFVSAGADEPVHRKRRDDTDTTPEKTRVGLSRPSSLLAAMLLSSTAIAPVQAQLAAPVAVDGGVLPLPPEPFKGRLEPMERYSTPSYPSSVRAAMDAPNILLVMTDDVGFAASSTFGGPIPTPNLDRLAAHGLKYNQFHTTAICSPTRAALLTGRNHHAVGMATVVEMTSPYPGYSSVIPKSAATVARILRGNGYSTAMFGKHHNVPSSEQSAAGPFDHWPTGLGFDYFYGFVVGETDQFRPALYEGIRPIDGSQRAGDYILDRDLADHAITWLHTQKAAAPDKPFFIYYAPGSAHAPHQAPADWIAKFRGKFAAGWDQQRAATLARQKAMGIVPLDTDLAARPPEIPAWDSLSVDEQRINARYMEVYAGMLAYQDAQFGRVLDELERMRLLDTTLVIFIEGDNGASGEGGPKGLLNAADHTKYSPVEEQKNVAWLAQHLDIMGGPTTYENYPIGWALAMDTPFPWVKQIASHLGGVRNGLVISWPKRIKQQGELRTQYHHVIDIMPTVLDAAHVKAPTKVDGIAQQRIDGVSMTYSFDAPNAPSMRQTQYYEMLGNRGLYHDGWLANTTPRNMPWDIAQPRPSSGVTAYKWELYDLATDFSQAHDLAAKEPKRLKEMRALFDKEARRNNVYPIQDSGSVYRYLQNARSARGTNAAKTRYLYWGKNIRLSYAAAPPIFASSFSLQASVEIPDSGANGVIAAAGSMFGGWSFYLKDGKPIAYAAASQVPGQQFRVAAEKSLSSGPNTLRFDFDAQGGGGIMTISVNDTEVARGTIARRAHFMAGIGETFDIGRDANVPVTDDYEQEGVFTGEIKSVEVDVKQTTTGSLVEPQKPTHAD